MAKFGSCEAAITLAYSCVLSLLTWVVESLLTTRVEGVGGELASLITIVNVAAAPS